MKNRRFLGRATKISIGDRFGRLTVKAFSRSDAASRYMWICLCECGVEKEIAGTFLRRGRTKSCGCLQRERASEAAKRTFTQHGQAKKPEYVAWQQMFQRCTNRNHPSYLRYGRRGIKICKRWNSFEAFLEDVGPRPSSKHSLDRIDNDRGYEPDNVRWATPKQQASNRKKPNRRTP